MFHFIPLFVSLTCVELLQRWRGATGGEQMELDFGLFSTAAVKTQPSSSGVH